MRHATSRRRTRLGASSAAWIIAACGGGHTAPSAAGARPEPQAAPIVEPTSAQQDHASAPMPAAGTLGSAAGKHAMPADTRTIAAIGGAGMAAAGTDAAGRGGREAAGSTAAGSGGATLVVGGAAGAPPSPVGPLTLTAVDAEALSDGFVAFPETARPPSNRSPGFRWTGVPAEAKSLVLAFRDVSSPIPPVKWLLWNIPPDRTEIPADVSGASAMPSEVAGASQLGSLGNQGYAGPCCVGNEYEWVVYALDVAELPDTAGRSTAQIHANLLPEHTIEQSEAVMMRIKN
jgi:Raf kinase inhibitor-like YbhB/YbcL family protein